MMTAEDLVDRDGSRCHYCGEETWLARGEYWLREPQGLMATVDHRTPKSRGGSDRARNLVLACRGCNTAKNKRPYLDYVFQMLEEGRRDSVYGEVRS